MPVKPKAPIPREAEVQRAILAYLKLAGVRAWRNNTGATSAEHAGRRRFVRFGERGSADIHALFGPGARFLAIEVKRPGKRPTPAQFAWLRAINAAGGLAFWAIGVGDVRRVLDAVAANPRLRVVIEGDGTQYLTDEDI